MPIFVADRAQLQSRIAPHLDAIAKLFRNPCVTLFVRAPDLKDGDFVMTTDTYREIITGLQALEKRFPQQPVQSNGKVL